VLIALPVSHRDLSLAGKAIRWMGQLHSSYHRHHAFVIGSATLTVDQIQDLVSGLRSAGFHSVASIRLRTEDDRGWPFGPNLMFRMANQYIALQQREPFLWCEPDAIPLRAGWLDAIDQEYRIAGKPYMGTIFDKPWPHITGVAVYPANVNRFNPASLGATDKPFDTVRPDLTIKHSHLTKLICHVWGDAAKNIPPTFPTGQSLAMVPSDAMVFHRCKDGTLIDRLSELNGDLPVAQLPRKGDWADFVSLRRNGDIICILPLMRELARRFRRKVRIVVHEDYAPILEGVSYIDAVVWKGNFDDPLPVASAFKAVNLQVYGKGLPQNNRQNFAKLSWDKAGYPFKRHLPLVFDRRNFRREKKLAKSVFHTGNPKILLNFLSYSSPFKHGRFLAMAFTHLLPECEVIDLSKVKAERVYDVIGLMDRASCLITVDTSTLWLCHASHVPTIQLVNGSHWGSSPPRGNVLFRLPYSQAMSSWKMILEFVRSTLYQPTNQNIVLVYSDWVPKDEENRMRNAKCQETWKRLGANRELAYSGGRSAKMFGDVRHTPFVRDMIDQAFSSGDEEIAVLTNNDISFDWGLKSAILESCRKHGCYWSYRVEKPGHPTDEGSDCFAISRKWWMAHQHQFPDFLLGFFWWDDILIRIMRWSGCAEQERLYYHAPHADARTRQDSPGMKYNTALALDWLRVHDEEDQKPLSEKRDVLTGAKLTNRDKQ
jgi:hypothetical protein